MLVTPQGAPIAPTWLPSYTSRAEALQTLRAKPHLETEGELETAKYYGDWHSVERAYRSKLEANHSKAEHHSALGLALLRQGDIAEAHHCSTRAALLDPTEIGGRQLDWELREWQPQARWVPPLPTKPRCAERLRLEPLGPHHWEDLLWQYGDPEIARLCCLPRFKDYAHYRNWLAKEYAQGDNLMFAIMENTWGFCGVVSLILQRGVGFVYYWLGQDFRGQGLAAEAVDCLLLMACELWALKCCYAKAFESNQPSRRLLTRAGFAHLPVVPLAPHADECLYRLGPPQEPSETRCELQQLLWDMKSDLRLPPQITPL